MLAALATSAWMPCFRDAHALDCHSSPCHTFSGCPLFEALATSQTPDHTHPSSGEQYAEPEPYEDGSLAVVAPVFASLTLEYQELLLIEGQPHY